MSFVRRAISHPSRLLAATVVGGAFLAGLMAPEIRAQGALPALQRRLDAARGKNGPDPGGVFDRVHQTLMERAFRLPPEPQALTYAAIRGTLRVLDDPYTRFLDERAYTDLLQENKGAFEDVGLQLETQRGPSGEIQVHGAQAGTPAAKAGIHSGDRLLRIDGKPVAPLSIGQVVHALRGPSGSAVRLTLLRFGDRHARELSLVRAPVEYEVLTYSLREGGVGYVSLSEFNDVADGKLERAVRELEKRGMRALILDLRGNPGGMFEAAVDIASRFVPAGAKIVSVRGARGETEERTSTPGRQFNRRYPVAVLVNRMSASASEIVAGAIKDNHAGIIIGTRTFGKGLIQTVFPLPSGCGMLVTSGKYVTPSGADINRSPSRRGGVTPDIEVELTADQFARGEDVQLNRAIQYLHARAIDRKAPQAARNPN